MTTSITADQYRILIRHAGENRGRAYLGHYTRDATTGRLIPARDVPGGPTNRGRGIRYDLATAEGVANWLRQHLPNSTITVRKAR